jgi:ribosomal protein S18 acetylase RimI-like enzyme
VAFKPITQVKIRLCAVTSEDEPFEVALWCATHQLLCGNTGLAEGEAKSLALMQIRAQRLTYHAMFPRALWLMILADDVPVGRYIYSEEESAIFFIDIMILPEYQNRGIGSSVIEPQMNSAKTFGKTIFLHVEKQNVRARALYERLGFALCDGEDETHYRMKWMPQ